MTRLLKVILVFCFFSQIDYIYAQSSVPKTEYENLLSAADSLFEERKFYEAVDYYLKACNSEKSKPEPDQKKIGNCYGFAGECFDELGKYENALDYYHTALDYAKKTNDSSEIAILHSNIAQTNVKTGRYDEAIKNFQISLDYDRVMGNQSGIATNLSALGKVYEHWGKYDDAINYFNQALEIDRRNGNESKVAIRLSALASIYKTKGDFNKSLKYLDEALKIELKLKNKYKIAVRYDQIGEIYQGKKDYEKAGKYFTDALNLLNKIEKETGEGDNRTTASHSIILNHLGKNYALTGNNSKALGYLNQSLKLARTMNYHLMLVKNYRDLSDLYKANGNYHEAYNYYVLYTERKDSAFNAENRKIISEFREKFETEKKEKEIAILTKDKEVSEINLSRITQQRTYIALLVILFAFLSALAYNRYRFKRKVNLQLEDKNKELEELNAAKNRFFSIISHDLKSPITSFQKITGSLNRSIDEIDRDTLKQFINDMNDTAVSLNDFLKKLLQWAMSQSGRVAPKISTFSLNEICDSTGNLLKQFADGNAITINKNCDESIKVNADKEMIETAFRNLLANAIKFSNPGTSVKVEITKIDSHAKISVTNCGPGLSNEDAKLIFRIDTNHSKIGSHPAKGSGLGLILANELVKLNGGEVVLESALPEKTTFSIMLPIYNN